MTPGEIMYTAYEVGVKANIYLTLMQAVAWIGMVLNIALVIYIIVSEVKERKQYAEKPVGTHSRLGRSNPKVG